MSINSSIEITTWDIAKLYYDRDISLSETTKISNEIWNNKKIYLGISVYSDKEIFLKEIDDILGVMIFKSKLILEGSNIKSIQEEFNLDYDYSESYVLGLNKAEEFLKQIRLRLDFEIKREFVYMKMRTLMRKYGYKKRNQNFLNKLNSHLEDLNLYVGVKDSNPYSINELLYINLDDTIRIYSYGNFSN